MESKLMPCKCGADCDCYCWRTSEETYYLECDTCGYTTKKHKTVECAEKEWETRNDKTPMTTSEPTTAKDINVPTKGEGEFGVKFNAPTTGEIVRNLRELVYEAERKHETQLLCTNELIIVWAHDLERRESDIAALTARAEQAELERDAAIRCMRVDNSCSGCVKQCESVSVCEKCIDGEEDGYVFDIDTWRGQPQDGEGV